MESQSKKSTIIQGKQPPQSIEMEEVVLGAMLIDSKGVDEALTILRSSDVFHIERHQLIFEAILELYNHGRPVDLRTVSQQLKVMGKLERIGGDFFLIGLTQKVASSAHTEYHCRILMQYYVKRRLIMINSQIIALCYDESTDVFDLMDSYQKGFDGVVDATSKGRKTMSFSNAMDHLKGEVELLSANKDDIQLVGKTTGFKRTDKHTGGYRDQDLVIIAARPGMGKTAKVLKTAISNASQGIPVGIISLEMSIHQLTARAVALDTNFHLGQLLKHGFEKNSYFQRYDEHAARMKKYPLYIDDSGESDITEIVITAKMWKRVHGIELLVIDYLQLMGDKSVKGNREGEISSISRRLKKLAKELNIPIIALSQLSRAVETRGGSKRPMLSDLRESGAIEQDADIVEFIYRPGYYNIEMNEDEYESAAHKQAIALGADTEIIYAKYRGGSTGTALLKWVGDKTKFIDVEDGNDTADYEDAVLVTATPAEAFDMETKTVFD
jgi:replicative DNA helicase